MNAHGPRLLFLTLLAASPLAGADTYTVTSSASGGGACTANSTTDIACTLADAIATAVSGDDIAFAPEVQGQTISGSYDLDKVLLIDASPGGIVLDGGGSATVFQIQTVANVTLSHLTVQHGSSATDGGGIYLHDHGTLRLNQCTVAHNTAAGSGGGIYNSGYLWVIDSTLYDNSAANGGGIYNPAPFGSVVMTNSTVAGNSASTAGGGMHSSSAIVLRSSLIAGNTSPTAADVDNIALPSSALSTYGYNLIGDGTDANIVAAAPGDQIGTAQAPIDPLFAPAGLADNGGATPTVALRSPSPARTGGACSSDPGPPHIDASVVDQRDVPRSTPCTIGAFDMTAVFYDGFDAP